MVIKMDVRSIRKITRKDKLFYHQSIQQKNVLQCIFVCWLVIASSFPRIVAANGTLVLNTTFTAPLSTKSQSGFVDVIVSKALEHIGCKLESVYLPAERALINANAGIDDGDLLRIGGLQKTYINLIQVSEPVINIEFVVFTKNINSPINSWQDLKPYSVSIITGWKILERNITDTVELTKVKNEFQLFTILEKNRVDAIIYSRWLGLNYIKQQHVRGVKVLEPPLAQKKCLFAQKTPTNSDKIGCCFV